ncbi:nuclear transport factor 2 family protein [Streptomyces hyaluromycini]|uniref:nuclear transport factor 2 family protein n=1 Tax=Streptomyces hyaluromycini TaxID=1377993 RepID=UPI000B5CE280|nr:nuclear transport factor 2 family protein [Streptomyces hyaluromycini]
MTTTTPEQNRALVVAAFDTLFNRRDYSAAERYWSPDYIQHSAHIGPGRDGLFDLIKSLPAHFRHEIDFTMAEDDMVMVRGRFSGHGQPRPWIAVDFVRIEDGLLKEHWDVIEDEASRTNSASGLPMYGTAFPNEP